MMVSGSGFASRRWLTYLSNHYARRTINCQVCRSGMLETLCVHVLYVCLLKNSAEC